MFESKKYKQKVVKNTWDLLLYIFYNVLLVLSFFKYYPVFLDDSLFLMFNVFLIVIIELIYNYYSDVVSSFFHSSSFLTTLMLMVMVMAKLMITMICVAFLACTISQLYIAIYIYIYYRNICWKTDHTDKIGKFQVFCPTKLQKYPKSHKLYWIIFYATVH